MRLVNETGQIVFHAAILADEKFVEEQFEQDKGKALISILEDEAGKILKRQVEELYEANN